MKKMLDYWLSKFFYDLNTDKALAAEYRNNRDDVMSKYPLSESVVSALRRDDVAFLAGLTDGFLLRYYFLVIGMTDRNFIDGLQPLRRPAAPKVQHG